MLTEEKRRKRTSATNDELKEQRSGNLGRVLGANQVVNPVHAILMPTKATPFQVIGLTEALEGMEQPVEVSRLVHRFRGQTPDFLSVLRAAQELGLVEREKEHVALTNLGLGFLRASDGKIRIIRVGLSRIDPFKTALELLARKKYVSAHDVSTALSNKNNFSSSSLEKDDDVATLLIEWGISAELFKYEGKKRRFLLA